MATCKLYHRSTIGMNLTDILDEMVSTANVVSMAEALDNKVKTKVSIKWGRTNFECYISNKFQLSPLLRFNCARKILGSLE
ncbi:transcription initiation factor IIA subunit 2 [Tanacetum coccineum]